MRIREYGKDTRYISGRSNLPSLFGSNAVAHPYLLAAGELCVCDIVRVLDLPQPKVSRHLAYLRRAGLVTARRDGFWMHYELAPAKTSFHLKMLECLSCCFADVPELAKDAKTLGKTCRQGPCCD